MKLLIWGALMLLLLAAFTMIPRKKRTKTVGCALVLIAVLFELFVANFHSYHLLGGDYEEIKIDLTSDTIHTRAFEEEGGLLSNDKGWECAVTIKDVNAPVGTVALRCKLPEADEESKGTSYVDVWIDAKDETHSATYRSGVADGKIIRGDDRSAVIVLDLTGEVKDLCIRFKTEEGKSFVLEEVVLNRALPMSFSILRSLLLIFVAFAVFALAGTLQ